MIQVPKTKPSNIKLKKVKIKFSSQRTLHNMLLTLRKQKVRFTTEDTSGSFKIRVVDVVNNLEKIYEYNSPSDLIAMGVFMKLKKEILSRRYLQKQNLREYTPRDLKYWAINSLGFTGKLAASAPISDGANNGAKSDTNSSIKQVTNIDVKKAYPYAFHRLGFIGRDVLKYLLDLDSSGKKISRLKAMGILAKQKLVNSYGSGKMSKSVILQDVYLRSCFFNACKVIDDLMLKCVELCGGSSSRNFLFFWVDGIYVNTSTKSGKIACKRICKLIKKSGYKYSREILRDFKYSPNSPNSSDSSKQVLNISFRKKNSRGKYARKPKVFSLPLNSRIQERLY